MKIENKIILTANPEQGPALIDLLETIKGLEPGTKNRIIEKNTWLKVYKNFGLM